MDPQHPSRQSIDSATGVKAPSPPTKRQIEIARRCGHDPFADYRRRYSHFVDQADKAVEQGLTTWDAVNDAAAAAKCHLWVRVVDVAPKATRTPGKRSANSRRPRPRRRTRRTQSRGDPDDPEPGEPWALSFADRAPVVWRLRAARCTLLELREGVGR